MVEGVAATTIVVILTCVMGAAIAIYHAIKIAAIPIAAPAAGAGVSSNGFINSDDELKNESDVNTGEGSDPNAVAADSPEMYERIKEISGFIRTGADAFLFSEYKYISVFSILFAGLLFVIVGAGHSWKVGGWATLSFLVGALTSVISGFIGMRIAVTANSRTAINARFGYELAFGTAFKAGMVMGFGLVSLGVLVLYILIGVISSSFSDWDTNMTSCNDLFEAVAGYGLGGSTIALFGRVGGGIYTKAADVGADLSGKVCNDFPEDDPRNPAVIADNVGDNVGDIAGMGADLFGSLAEGSCACMVIASSSSLQSLGRWDSLCFPLAILGMGLVASFATSFVATHIKLVSRDDEIEPSLKRQLLVSTIVMTPIALLISMTFLPQNFTIGTTATHNWHIFFCVTLGLWCGLAIGYITEYFTSFAYKPVRECATACQAGAAPNIIYGLALGYKSAIIPVVCLCITIYISYSLAEMFGIATAAMGILSTLATGLAIDAYGPICDNAGGIAEMCHMPHTTRERTDNLDAAGNTTAAIGKGFAIGSAALVSLALFGAFVTAARLSDVNILKPYPFAGLLFGAMIPYWFSALTMKSVGTAAFDMVKEVERQLDPNTESGREIRAGQRNPDYHACIAISTKASLREMIAPGALVMFTPIIVGFLFGTQCLAGVLAGNLVSGVQIAISASNTGGAWDNAKKYIGGVLGKKGTDEYKAAVVGDTVGDPLKDTSGPSINILIKLMAIISVVFARSYPADGWLKMAWNSGKK